MNLSFTSPALRDQTPIKIDFTQGSEGKAGFVRFESRTVTLYSDFPAVAQFLNPFCAIEVGRIAAQLLAQYAFTQDKCEEIFTDDFRREHLGDRRQAGFEFGATIRVTVEM